MDAALREVDGEDPNRAARPIRVGGTILGPHRHVCAFFSSPDDQYRLLLPFKVVATRAAPAPG